MGKHLLSVLLCIVSQFSFSQNWSVINMTDKFNYRLDDDPVITATIWADSVHWNGNDSVFYLNRVMCDTCVTLIGGPNPCDTCYGLKNQPQFLQRTAYISSSGVVNFRDTANRVILTLSALNDTWMFDSLPGITATVIATTTDSVFGSLDSIKIMMLSTGDTLKLSRNYGLLQYPNHYGQNSYYRLAGIEGRNLGVQLPKFNDFFNFNVGDMFEYHGRNNFYEHCISPFDFEACDLIRKYLITAKQISGDTIIYNLEGQLMKQCMSIAGGPLMFATCIDSINEMNVYIDSSGHVSNKYNHETFYLDNHLPFGGIPISLNGLGNGTLRMKLDSNSILSKSFGLLDISGSSQIYFIETLLSVGSDTIYISPLGSAGCSYAINYKTGLGIVDFSYGMCFELLWEEHLVAYRKGNDTVGVFTPDSDFTVGIQDIHAFNPISVYPNPANDVVFITSTVQSGSEISLADLQGKELIATKLNFEKTSLDVSQIASGLYFLTIRMQERTFTRKVLIMH